jgi:hypothetical protein
VLEHRRAPLAQLSGEPCGKINIYLRLDSGKKQRDKKGKTSRRACFLCSRDAEHLGALDLRGRRNGLVLLMHDVEPVCAALPDVPLDDERRPSCQIGSCASIERRRRKLLAEFGIRPRNFALIGAATMRFSKGDLYEPDIAFLPYLVTPARVHTAVHPEPSAPVVYCLLGDIVDLVAWQPSKPNHSALHKGTGESLGAIQPQYLDPDPVLIWRSPLRWFQSGCNGLVLLSRSAVDQYRILCGCRVVVAEGDEHARELRRVIERPFRRLRIIIGAPCRAP